MPIDVTCPGCHKRFKVSEKFAGKEGPCPNCKAKIRIPDKSEQVVVHAPEAHGPKDASGHPTLKPIARSETRFSPLVVGGVVVFALATLVTAIVLRSRAGAIPWQVLAGGAWVLGPALSWAGYTFLRNDELAPYRGLSLGLRATICGTVYAALWGAYAALKANLFDGSIEPLYLAFIVPPFVVVGALASLASLDLDFGNGAIHYGLYVLVTVTLCWIMGVPVY